MKNIALSVVVISLLTLACKHSAKTESMQPYAGYPLFDNIDSIKKELSDRFIDTIKLEKGDAVADIGAGNGYVEGMLTLFCDSVTFYIQDIDTGVCNQAAVDKVTDFYKKMKKSPFTNRFIPVIGTDSTSNLPDSTFDRILMLFTYQYIKKPLPYISDVRKKLKKDGLFYVINPQYGDYSNIEFQRKEYGWNASPLEKEISDIINCGFELVRMERKYGDSGAPYLMVFRIREKV